MAQVIWQELGKGDWIAESAGSQPAGYVHPLLMQVLEEIGLKTSHLTSKSLSLFLNQEFDLAVTVCDHAKDACPMLPGVATTLHWPFQDPADEAGSDEEKLACFRAVRDQIRNRIKLFLDQ